MMEVTELKEIADFTIPAWTVLVTLLKLSALITWHLLKRLTRKKRKIE